MDLLGQQLGEILSIEVLLSIGKGKLTITGKLGDVMKESIQAATSYVRSKSLSLGIHPKEFERLDLHIHVPEGQHQKTDQVQVLQYLILLYHHSLKTKLKKMLL